MRDLGLELRAAMGAFATGVTVVTSRRVDGSPLGTTVNAVTSVSLDPPLLLVCLALDSETLTAVRSSSRFAVNVLAENQGHHSIRFATKGTGASPEDVDFGEHELGLPYLQDSLATIACRVEAMHRAGDHEIVIGEAMSIAVDARRNPPLLFFRGAYSRLAADAEVELVATTG